VSAVDLVELRKLILGIYSELPNNQSWRFIDAKQSLSAVSPWPINEEVNISSLTADMMDEDFVASKVGDVNGSAISNATDVSTETRSAKHLEFITERVGNSIVVKAGSNFNEVYGYQYTMKVAGQLTEVYQGSLDLTAANFGVLDNGEVTTSFSSETSISLSEGDVLFTLEGVESIELVDGYTRAEAYTGTTMEIGTVEFRDGKHSLIYELGQNKPNPFSDVTNISFTLGKAGTATITVFDVTGKVIKTVKGEYERGMHRIQLAKKDLGSAGVLYYQLESGDFVTNKKMILID